MHSFNNIFFFRIPQHDYLLWIWIFYNDDENWVYQRDGTYRTTVHKILSGNIFGNNSVCVEMFGFWYYDLKINDNNILLRTYMYVKLDCYISDLWPSDPNVNSCHPLLRGYQYTKFYFYKGKSSKILSEHFCPGVCVA